MKKTLAVILLLMVGTFALANTTAIQVKDRTKKNLFVFTAGKSMRGAHVQVYHSSGDLVAAQMLKKRRMVIDFCDVVEGSYTIVVVSNDGHTERFQFEKK